MEEMEENEVSSSEIQPDKILEDIEEEMCREQCDVSDIVSDIGEMLNDSGMNSLKLKEFPELLKYINTLQSYILEQKEQIKRLRHKLRKTGNKKSNVVTRDTAVQTDFDNEHAESIETTPLNSEQCSDGAWQTGNETSTVAEQVKQVAENAMNQTGFVYEETSGMYYDYNTGYYYNAELGLYYDGNTGTYYYYDEKKNEFQFHSQIEQRHQPQQPPEQKKEKQKRVEEKKKRKAEDSLEEGECSETSEEEEEEVSSDAESTTNDVLSDQSAQWPPCMRIIIKKSSIEKLKVGSLFIVTYTGGTVGREGDHVFCLPDINVSKSHMKLEFDKEKGNFYVEDLGSRNGTVLNGQRLKEGEEGRQEVVHGSTIVLGGISLLCHIHAGRDATCGHCEPGLIQKTELQVSNSTGGEKQIVGKKEVQHRKELKRLRRKFGLENTEPKVPNLVNIGYEDRAQVRRETVGSQNAYEKTQTALLDEPIPSQNKGYQLLEKMGWSQGQSLGKDGEGITEPVPVTTTRGTAGLGTELLTLSDVTAEVTLGPATSGEAARSERWRKAQQRYKELE